MVVKMQRISLVLMNSKGVLGTFSFSDPYEQEGGGAGDLFFFGPYEQ